MPKTTINVFNRERQIIPNSLEELEEERKEIFAHFFNHPRDYKRKMFSVSLSYFMEVQHLKATELSAITQIPEPMISDYIRCKYAPRGNTLFTISNYFRVNPDWMIGIPGSEMKNETITKIDYEPKKILDSKELAMNIVKALDKPLSDVHIYSELLETILTLNLVGLSKMNEYGLDLTKIKTYKN